MEGRISRRPRGRAVRRPLPGLRSRADRPDVPPRLLARVRQRGEPLLLRGGAERRSATASLRAPSRLEGGDRAAADTRRLRRCRLRRPDRRAVRVRNPQDVPLPRSGRPTHAGDLGRGKRGSLAARPRPQGARQGGGRALRRSAVRPVPLPRPPRGRRGGRAGAPRLAVRRNGAVQLPAGVVLPRESPPLRPRAVPRLERQENPPRTPRSLRLHEGGLHTRPLGAGGDHVVLRGAPPRARRRSSTRSTSLRRWGSA